MPAPTMTRSAVRFIGHPPEVCIDAGNRPEPSGRAPPSSCRPSGSRRVSHRRGTADRYARQIRVVKGRWFRSSRRSPLSHPIPDWASCHSSKLPRYGRGGTGCRCRQNRQSRLEESAYEVPDDPIELVRILHEHEVISPLVLLNASGATPAIGGVCMDAEQRRSFTNSYARADFPPRSASPRG
jgi:hypothetical protein